MVTVGRLFSGGKGALRPRASANFKLSMSSNSKAQSGELLPTDPEDLTYFQ